MCRINILHVFNTTGALNPYFVTTNVANAVLYCLAITLKVPLWMESPIWVALPVILSMIAQCQRLIVVFLAPGDLVTSKSEVPTTIAADGFPIF